MVSCPICEKDFKDKRGLYGHSRFVHGIDYKSGKPAKIDTPAEVTKEELEKINKGRELTEALEEKELQTRSIDEQINEAKEKINRLSKVAKAEINRLGEEVKRLNEGVDGVRDMPPMAGSDSVTPEIPSTSQKAGKKSTQPVLRRENIDGPTAGSGGRGKKGMPEEINDDPLGVGFSGVDDILPRPRRFLRRWREKWRQK